MSSTGPLESWVMGSTGPRNPGYGFGNLGYGFGRAPEIWVMVTTGPRNPGYGFGRAPKSGLWVRPGPEIRVMVWNRDPKSGLWVGNLGCGFDRAPISGSSVGNPDYGLETGTRNPGYGLETRLRIRVIGWKPRPESGLWVGNAASNPGYGLGPGTWVGNRVLAWIAVFGLETGTRNLGYKLETRPRNLVSNPGHGLERGTESRLWVQNLGSNPGYSLDSGLRVGNRPPKHGLELRPRIWVMGWKPGPETWIVGWRRGPEYGLETGSRNLGWKRAPERPPKHGLETRPRIWVGNLAPKSGLRSEAWVMGRKPG
ncbi:hypothetical protein QAD02_005880 [Eretmocerus hayati]|uniref:Uncharacterized protein n=1 Tax=Eretmocerus hayati TaxID=131215 RepID=A0ACC2NTS3_9HYME|nr:hypothetical protein QAD02_005880 [Eretmocerus hayati]